MLLLVLSPVIMLGILVRWRTRVLAKGKERWAERWGRLTLPPDEVGAQRPWWWVHAASLGEVKAIEPFLRRVPAQTGARVLLSAVTPEALAWASAQKIAEHVIAAPLDLPWVVRRVFRQVRPAWFISVESEFWPNLLREARRSGARIALINGRLSARSFRSYFRIRGIVAALWDCLDVWAVRQEEDAGRFRALGVPPAAIHVTGNLKYDVPLPESGGGFRIPAADPLVVIGSTREGEEARLLPVIERLCQETPAMKVIWAPRHIERVEEVHALLASAGQPVQRKSVLAVQSNGAASRVAHIVWDSMGDLLEAYRRADVALVGGSFVSKGGQNPIEPASLKVPVVFGPSMENFAGIAEILVEQGGARQVTLEQLEGCLRELFRDASVRQRMGTQARRTVESRQGATDRTIRLLASLS